MGTTAEKLAYLDATKTAIKDAIVAKGVEVPEGTTFRAYADKIDEIETGVSGNAVIPLILPPGVVGGDIVYDGDWNSLDLAKGTRYFVGMESVDINDPELKNRYDVNGDGVVNRTDFTVLRSIHSYTNKLGRYCKDNTEVYTVNPNYDSEPAQFYIDLPIEKLTALTNAHIYTAGSDDIITRAEFAGKNMIRVFVKMPPAESKTYWVYVSDGAGVISCDYAPPAVDIYDVQIMGGSKATVDFNRSYGVLFMEILTSSSGFPGFSTLSNLNQSFSVFPDGESVTSFLIDDSEKKITIQELGVLEGSNSVEVSAVGDESVYFSIRIYASTYNPKKILFYGG